MALPLVQIENLATEFKTDYGILRGLSDVDLSIPKGETVGLVGESGSGKSTIALSILKLLSNNARIVSGRIFFNGDNLLDKTEKEMTHIRGSKISMVFQDPLSSLNPSLTIGEQISEMITIHKYISKKAATQEALKLMTQVGISNAAKRMNQYPHHLSGGMQQRILIAMAISCNPQLLILDEPTTALDVTIEAQIIELLNVLKTTLGLTMLYITHNLGVLNKICNSIRVVYSGQILDEMSREDLFNLPLHPYTQGLMSCIPQIFPLERRTTRLNNIPGKAPDLENEPFGCVFHPRCPFVLPRCKEELQDLREIKQGRRIRCWRYSDPQITEWPKAKRYIASHNPFSQAEVIVRVEDLNKTFEIGRRQLKFVSKERTNFFLPLRFESQSLAAVDNVSFEIRKGEIFGLVGESGCGKTTLGRCLLRLIDPTSGKIYFNSQDISKIQSKELRDYRRKVQAVFQNPDSSLNPRKTIQQIIGRPIDIYQKHIEKQTSKDSLIDKLLEAVALPKSFKTKYPHELSGGQKQRIGIARALAFDPEIIICDEPVTALDVSIQANIINLLLDLREQFGLSLMFIAHDLSVVAHMSHRIAVMYRGHFCEVAPPDQLFSQPTHPYTKNLLASIPFFHTRLSDKAIPQPVAASIESKQHYMCPFSDKCNDKRMICEIERPHKHWISTEHYVVCHNSSNKD